MALRMQCEVVPQPAFILVEDINPYHQHVDFTYFARLDDDDAQDVAGENGFSWFRPDDLTMDDVPENVREGARQALAYYGLDRNSG